MEIFFYLFASLMIISSCLVVISKNPIYSVLWLIFSFCNASGLMILLGAEFLAMMLIVIYVGAVAVLFLFVIMMLDIHSIYVVEQFKRNLLVSSVVALIMFTDFILIILLGTKNIPARLNDFVASADISNTKAIGLVLYTDFILPFQMAGIILFVAMISCIILTVRHRPGVKRQNIVVQNSKSKENSLLILNPDINEGIEGIKYE
ncbi:NADH-quinone oxidoreductase subunit J [Candidatus Tisiphia endosymbiont of Beris chalybata]|uniref:NADH-quinone oxidoreductase subunit J n=1 Tax=Candidatus Tisiphia endosymbiont of Beris chalybata TaxID=3066262 RepID=UPI00312CB038